MLDYSFLDKALHHIVLGSENIKKIFFEVEKKLFYKENNFEKFEKHIFISGLPRSGTTILLEFLHNTRNFASLTYEDVPFIMSPNLSSFFFKKKRLVKKKRPHNDRILHDINSPEAFDDVFFLTMKNNLKNDYIKLVSLVLKKYKKKKYLSKNNNNYKRINLINSQFINAKILLPYRDPLQHAYSLLNQHINFCTIQKKNKFVLDYMNYLNHKEFGLNYKPWNKPEKFIDYFDVNHWLEQWCLFYNNLLENSSKFKNVILINYDDFCKNIDLPKKLLNIINEPETNYTSNFEASEKKIIKSYDEKYLENCLELNKKLNLHPYNLENIKI
jgi:hypothetical protein